MFSRRCRAANVERMDGMLINVVVAYSEPLVSEGIAQSLGDEPQFVPRASTGSPQETLEECHRLSPCVLVIEESFVERIDVARFRDLVDYGRAVRVLVLGTDACPDDVSAWVRLGCMGFLSRQESLATLKKAIQALAEGQLWVRRSEFTGLMRDLLVRREFGPQLTGRETQILDLIAAGSSNGEIARTLFISMETVRWHVRRLMGKIGARDRFAAAEFHRRYHVGLPLQSDEIVRKPPAAVMAFPAQSAR